MIASDEANEFGNAVTPEQQSDFMKLVAANTKALRAMADRYVSLPPKRGVVQEPPDAQVTWTKKEVFMSDLMPTVLTKAEQDAYAEAVKAMGNQLDTMLAALVRAGIVTEDELLAYSGSENDD